MIEIKNKKNRIGLIDVDGHNFPNLALMKISGWYKNEGCFVEWVNGFESYDLIYKSKVFTFTPDDRYVYNCKNIVKGGTGYDIKTKLPEPIDSWLIPDYTIYPNFPFSVQFYSRGCIRNCPFCLVREKEGFITPVEPMALNPNGKWIEVLDNNFFANPDWQYAIKDLKKNNLPVKFHGVDIRIMNEEQAYALNSLKLKNGVHIAWDDPNLNLSAQLKEITRYIKPYNIVCYVLIGFNSTREQDLFRLQTLKRFGILPFVQPYRDYLNERVPSIYELDLARWANRAWLFKSCDFVDYSPRKGFKCKEYFN